MMLLKRLFQKSRRLQDSEQCVVSLSQCAFLALLALADTDAGPMDGKKLSVDCREVVEGQDHLLGIAEIVDLCLLWADADIGLALFVVVALLSRVLRTEEDDEIEVFAAFMVEGLDLEEVAQSDEEAEIVLVEIDERSFVVDLEDDAVGMRDVEVLVFHLSILEFEKAFPLVLLRLDDEGRMDDDGLHQRDPLQEGKTFRKRDLFSSEQDSGISAGGEDAVDGLFMAVDRLVDVAVEGDDALREGFEASHEVAMGDGFSFGIVVEDIAFPASVIVVDGIDEIEKIVSLLCRQGGKHLKRPLISF